EVYDYLRLLYARIGVPHCPQCGRQITRQTPQQIVDRVLELPEGTRFQVLAPVVRGRKGEYESLLADLGRQGYTRARVDGEVIELAAGNFAFNSPRGACGRCDGLGTRFEGGPEVVVSDGELSIGGGAIAPWAGFRGEYFGRVLSAVAAAYEFSTAKPWKRLKA